MAKKKVNILDFMAYKEEIDKMSGVIFRDKTPKNNKNHVGVEIEFYSFAEKNLLKYAFREMGIEQYVGIKGDGSLNGDDYIHPTLRDECGDHLCAYEYEITVCAPESKIKSVIKSICEVLENTESFIDSLCGLHVHLDMRHRDQKSCYKKLVKNMSAMFDVFPRRKFVGYCRPNRTSNWSPETPRYSAINNESYRIRKTLEVRVGEGSIKTKDINAWIDFLLTIVNSKKMPIKEIETVKDFKKFYKPKRKDIYNIIA